MNLSYLHQYFTFPNETGGTRSYDLARSFQGKGINVTIISATSDPFYNTNSRWNVVSREGLEIHYIYLPYGNHLSYFKRILVFVQFLWFATFRLFQIPADVVLATSTPLTIGVPALFKKWRHGTPFVFEVRDVWPEAVIAIGAIKSKLLQRILYYLEKIIYRNAIAIVPLSLDMQKSITDRYPQFKEKAQIVIENISEINRFQGMHEEEINFARMFGIQPRFSILYAGTFGKVNGINYVVELAERTLEKDPHLIYILIGGGVEKESIVNLAKTVGVLNRNLFVLDPISKDKLPIWYNSVNMGSSFVIDIPALWANSANKFFDTLAAGKPILINHEGWQGETIRQNNIGKVLPVQLTDDTVQEFVEYTQYQELHKTQSMNALQQAKREYSLEVALEKYLIVLSKIESDV